jgi:hypothetical protein
MKVFEFAGVIFNADNVCTVQKVTVRDEKDEENKIPAFQVVTIAGGMNFTFSSVKERDEKFSQLLKVMGEL